LPKGIDAIERREYNWCMNALLEPWASVPPLTEKDADGRVRKLHQRLHQQITQANVRARRYEAPGKITKGEWAEILSQSEGKCCHCKAFVGVESLTLEHVFPLSKGGSNYLDNIAAACLGCNTSKSDNAMPRKDRKKRVRVGQSLADGRRVEIEIEDAIYILRFESGPLTSELRITPESMHVLVELYKRLGQEERDRAIYEKQRAR
jgi:5-methylcytosine-specific restriction endonuclease McrA